MTIPVSTLFYLLSYVWEEWERGEESLHDSEKFHGFSSFLGHVLSLEVDRLLKRGLRREYRRKTESIQGVRGRILVAPTLAGMLMERGRTVCSYGELAGDTATARTLKCALSILRSDISLDAMVQDELDVSLSRFNAVADVHVTARQIRSLLLALPDRSAGFALRISRLVLEACVPSGTSGDFRFRSPYSGLRMHRLFEAFIRAYFRRMLGRRSCVRLSGALEDRSVTDADNRSLIPGYETDALVWAKPNPWIIEAKYYKEAMPPGRMGFPAFRNAHLYQLSAYLRAAERKHPAHPTWHGALVYARSGQAFRHDYRILGRRIRIEGIDLAASWHEISERMRTLISEPA